MTITRTIVMEMTSSSTILDQGEAMVKINTKTIQISKIKMVVTIRFSEIPNNSKADKLSSKEKVLRKIKISFPTTVITIKTIRNQIDYL
jgi:hypothetical protein